MCRQRNDIVLPLLTIFLHTENTAITIMSTEKNMIKNKKEETCLLYKMIEQKRKSFSNNIYVLSLFRKCSSYEFTLSLFLKAVLVSRVLGLAFPELLTKNLTKNQEQAGTDNWLLETRYLDSAASYLPSLLRF